MNVQEQVTKFAQEAKQTSLTLAQLNKEQRNEILLAIASHLKAKQSFILKENAKDQTKALADVKQGKLSKTLYDRLCLNEKKADQLAVYLEEVAKQEDPINQQEWAMELSPELNLYRYSCPIGAIGVIFESRPEVVVQIVALAIKSGNAVLLKGGSEAAYSNRILFDLIQEVLTQYDLQGAVHLLETRESVAALLHCDNFIDLIIPRGSNQFVSYIQSNTNIPVLGHASGICHIYVDKEADIKQAIDVICDAKTDYPAACNAVETVLLHKDIAQAVLPSLCETLAQKQVELRLDQASMHIYGKQALLATDEDWQTEYSDLQIAIKVIDSLDQAIKHINEYGSHHTDSIMTTQQATADTFFQLVDSACVFHNVSTRFSDGYVFGLGAEVGISTSKTHARGPVGLEGMVIYKYKLKGNGDIRSAFTEGKRQYTHKLIQTKNK